MADGVLLFSPVGRLEEWEKVKPAVVIGAMARPAERDDAFRGVAAADGPVDDVCGVAAGLAADDARLMTSFAALSRRGRTDAHPHTSWL